jgi:hypothetical protein
MKAKATNKILFTFSPLIIPVLHFFISSYYSERIIYSTNSIYLFYILTYLLGVLSIAFFLGKKSVLNWFISIVYSYFIFYLLSICTFTILNFSFSTNNLIETNVCEVENFHISTYRKSKIVVNFKGVEINLYLYSKKYLEYQKKHLIKESVNVNITYREGLFNTYIIDDFTFGK